MTPNVEYTAPAESEIETLAKLETEIAERRKALRTRLIDQLKQGAITLRMLGMTDREIAGAIANGIAVEARKHMGNPRCSRCHKRGHRTSDCPKRPSDA
jgi:hypothetical protein